MRTSLTFSFLSLFSMPQAYFTMIPLKYGLPALGVVFIIYQIRSQMIAQRNKKLENLDHVMDDKAIQDLIGDEDNSAKAKKEAEIRKQKAKVEARLAQEKKAANKKASTKKKKGTDDDDMDDEDAMATFAKVKNKKN
mmetsp:Transcript_15190/g.29024  ORF Transcript_15190/g.29024 Transcript_15190/m.29024 type:complete len:137 (-) Transcript_15190:149-559(-)